MLPEQVQVQVEVEEQVQDQANYQDQGVCLEPFLAPDQCKAFRTSYRRLPCQLV